VAVVIIVFHSYVFDILVIGSVAILFIKNLNAFILCSCGWLDL